MTQRKAPTLDGPAAPLTAAESEVLAAKLKEAFEPPPEDVRELDGTPEFLEVLDSLNPGVRARLGFKFAVLDDSRGRAAYLEDSDWGSAVPTPAALARRYGPGTYRVRPKCSRKGKQGGGFATEILVEILPPRSSSGAAAAPPAAAAAERGAFSNERVMGRLFDLLEKKGDADVERAAALSDVQIPEKMPPWVEAVFSKLQSKESIGELPDWLKAPLETFLNRMVESDDKPAEGAQP